MNYILNKAGMAKCICQDRRHVRFEPLIRYYFDNEIQKEGPFDRIITEIETRGPMDESKACTRVMLYKLLLINIRYRNVPLIKLYDQMLGHVKVLKTRKAQKQDDPKYNNLVKKALMSVIRVLYYRQKRAAKCIQNAWRTWRVFPQRMRRESHDVAKVFFNKDMPKHVWNLFKSYVLSIHEYKLTNNVYIEYIVYPEEASISNSKNNLGIKEISKKNMIIHTSGLYKRNILDDWLLQNGANFQETVLIHWHMEACAAVGG